MNAPRPVVKPSIASPPGTEDCGCCEPLAAQTPVGVENRSGLSAITYRIGDYARFRASLQVALASSAFAPLGRLRTGDRDDFTIGLIDAFACTADVLTFYQERIANESYLGTAVERVSLQEMGKLVGYRLRPGVAAETLLAFALETPPAPPPGTSREPGAFVTGVPNKLTIEPGLKVQSLPGPDEKPQIFESVERLADARPGWNAILPWMHEVRRPARGDTEAWLAGVRDNLKVGDALVFIRGDFVANPHGDHWDVRIIDGVAFDPAADRTRVSWRRGLGGPFGQPTQDVEIHVLRKRAAMFGHNAPHWTAMSLAFRADLVGEAATHIGDWPDLVATTTETSNQIDLDTVYPELRTGGYVVLAKGAFNYEAEPPPRGTHFELYRIDSVAEISRAQFGLSGKVTRLQLKGQNLATIFGNAVRETSVFLQSDRLRLARYPVNAALSGDKLQMQVGADGLLPGRRLIVRGVRARDGATVAYAATLVRATAANSGDASHSVLEITPPLPDALRRDSVVIHANAALASHGETVSQILGAGDAASMFQRFELQHRPLTWRAWANEIGAASELTVRVGDVAWRHRPTLYGTTSIEHSHVLTTDEHGRDFVVFGDGINGARLPTGVNNVRAVYRKGLGRDGNVAADKLTQLLMRPLGLKSVSNPMAAEGGADPEPVEAARSRIPMTTRTLGRVVSLLDYEDFARAFSGIAKAKATVLHLASGPAIMITVAGPDGARLGPSNPVWINLLGALKTSGDPHVNVRLIAHREATFRLGLRIRHDPAHEVRVVLAAVEKSLRQRYAFDRRELGEPVQQSQVIAAVQAVPGVVAVDISRLYRSSEAGAGGFNQRRLIAGRMHVANGIAVADEMLTIDPNPFEQLDVMP
jgi:hypothetical protein